MPQLGLVGKSLVGPGTDLGPGAQTVFAEGSPVSLVGDLVSPHGEAPHISATIKTGSTLVFAEGKSVVIKDLSQADCAHVVTTGATTVYAGSVTSVA
jgi:uncharacterized Zn-binding protein involved in type VI secretion